MPLPHTTGRTRVGLTVICVTNNIQTNKICNNNYVFRIRSFMEQRKNSSNNNNRRNEQRQRGTAAGSIPFHSPAIAAITSATTIGHFHSRPCVDPVSEWKIVIKDDVETKAQCLFRGGGGGDGGWTVDTSTFNIYKFIYFRLATLRDSMVVTLWTWTGTHTHTTPHGASKAMEILNGKIRRRSIHTVPAISMHIHFGAHCQLPTIYKINEMPMYKSVGR